MSRKVGVKKHLRGLLVVLVSVAGLSLWVAPAAATEPAPMPTPLPVLTPADIDDVGIAAIAATVPNRLFDVSTVRVNEPFTFEATVCADGDVAIVATNDNGVFLETSLAVGATNMFTGAINLREPGLADVAFTVTCPGGGVDVANLAVHVDSSGRIIDAKGDPVIGATVTLLRLGDAGTFEPVPSGSEFILGENTTNPMQSHAFGRYGWDVADGLYLVEVTAAGCDPADSTPMAVPPERPNGDIVLSCGLLDIATVPDVLAFTGAETVWAALIGLALLGAGAVAFGSEMKTPRRS